MNASVNVLCYKSKTLSNGENPLMICVCKDGKRTYKSLGVSVNPLFWDFSKDKPKRNCPNKEQIEQLISETLMKRLEVKLLKPLIIIRMKLIDYYEKKIKNQLKVRCSQRE